MSSTLTVTRTSEKDIKMRDLYVTVDGGEERTLLFGGSTTFALAAGEHRVEVTNRLYTKDETVAIGESDDARFLAANVWAGGIFAWALVILTGAYKITLERV